MTGYCEDCGETFCVCQAVEFNEPLREPTTHRELAARYEARRMFRRIPPDLLARLRVAVAQSAQSDETRKRSSKGALPDTAFSSIEWTVADTRALHAALTGVLDEGTASIAWFAGNVGVPIGRITSIALAEQPDGARREGDS